MTMEEKAKTLWRELFPGAAKCPKAIIEALTQACAYGKAEQRELDAKIAEYWMATVQLNPASPEAGIGIDIAAAIRNQKDD